MALKSIDRAEQGSNGRSPRLSWNILSNYVGNLWTAAIALATIPVYVRMMGITAYGLIGFYVSLQAIVNLLDAGLSTTLNREIARVGSDGDAARWLGDLTRTLEVIYWTIAGIVGILIAVLAHTIASDWIHGSGLSTANLQIAIVWLGLAIALEFPFVLYVGGLTGLQRQVELNALVIAFATLRSLGSVLVLWLAAPTVEAFFIWQAFVSLMQSMTAGFVLWRSLPHLEKPALFSLRTLRAVIGFSAELGAIGILAALLTQLPKLVLSKLLPLTAFGYFSLATVVAGGLYYLVTPVFQGVFPRLARLVATSDLEAETRLYHASCQLVSIAVLPIGLVLAFFPNRVLDVWTRTPAVGRHDSIVLTLLVVGTLLHAMYWIPYALQLAHGWSRLALWLDLAMVVITIPLTIVLAVPYGATGAAVGWITLNSVCLVVQIEVMHRRLVIGEKLVWLCRDVMAPLLASVLVVLPAWVIIHVQADDHSLWLAIAQLSVTTMAATFAAASATPAGSAILRRSWHRILNSQRGPETVSI